MATVRLTRPDLLEVLEDRGHRMTAPRRSIISLMEQKKEGFGAEELCMNLPNVGRATVYRTIRLLLEADVICKLAMPNGAPKYSLARAEHHHHTICVRCGTVGEFRDTTIERMMGAMGDDISGEIVAHRMEFFIVCRGCTSDTTA